MAVENTTIARPYAEAIFSIAKESGDYKVWSEALEFLAEVTKDAKLAEVFSDPNVEKPRLSKLLLEIGGDRLNEQARNLVKVLVENRRMGLLPEIHDLFESLRDESEGALEVHVKTSFPLKPAQETMLADLLQKRLGREIRISSEEDPNLIGGVLIRAGDLVIDASVQGKLHQLATELGI